jgi:hypothetical protein
VYIPESLMSEVTKLKDEKPLAPEDEGDEGSQDVGCSVLEHFRRVGAPS